MLQENITYFQLSNECKKALLEYCYMSFETLEEVEEFYKNRLFDFEMLTLEEAKRRCMQFPFDAGDFPTFEEYHQWYIDGGDIPDHGDSVYPSIEGGHNEWLDDGWHRFHSYVKKGFQFIPVLRIH